MARTVCNRNAGHIAPDNTTTSHNTSPKGIAPTVPADGKKDQRLSPNQELFGEG